MLSAFGDSWSVGDVQFYVPVWAMTSCKVSDCLIYIACSSCRNVSQTNLDGPFLTDYSNPCQVWKRCWFTSCEACRSGSYNSSGRGFMAMCDTSMIVDMLWIVHCEKSANPASSLTVCTWAQPIAPFAILSRLCIPLSSRAIPVCNNNISLNVTA